MRQIQIRGLRVGESDLLADFLYLAIHLPPGVEPLPREIIHRPELRHYWDGFGSRVGDLAVGADLAGTIVGIAWSRILAEPFPGYGNVGPDIPELSVAICPEVRSQGVGTALMERLLTDLAAAGYQQVSLSVDKTNRALRLYKRLGFNIVKENNTDFIMVKPL